MQNPNGNKRQTVSAAPGRVKSASPAAAAVLIVCLTACLAPASRCQAAEVRSDDAGYTAMPAYAAYVLKTQRPKLAAAFAARGFKKYPPRRVTFIVIKEARRLELWAQEGWSGPVWIKEYAVTALSGRPGPKLRQGDRQVPEGVYSVVRLNPDSDFDLSMELDYPNDFDRAAAAVDGRKKLGGDIFIHGGGVSAGCIAVGDDAVEELFTLVHDTGMENVRVVIAPRDFRQSTPHGTDLAHGARWLKILYNWLDGELLQYVEKKM